MVGNSMIVCDSMFVDGGVELSLRRGSGLWSEQLFRIHIPSGSMLTMSMISAGRSVKGVETLPCGSSAAMVDHRDDG